MIEFSQVQAATRCLGFAAPLYGRFGIVRQRWGNWDTQLCAHGIILCGKSTSRMPRTRRKSIAPGTP